MPLKKNKSNLNESVFFIFSIFCHYIETKQVLDRPLWCGTAGQR